MAHAQEWLSARAHGMLLPFYSSADIRDAGYKATCVDLNLFPAGFNNLCERNADEAARIVAAFVKGYFRDWPCQRVLIVPEAHSRNPFYNSHLESLRALLVAAGLTPAIAAMTPPQGVTPQELVTHDNVVIPLVPVRRAGDVLVDERDVPYDWILLNNDLSSGEIAWLDGLRQAILPPTCLGWHKRSKTRFFACYHALAAELAAEIGIDPWLLSTETAVVRDCTFATDAGRARVAAVVADVLQRIQAHYAQWGLNDTPRVFIKNDTGTYGMGIMTAESPEDILTMNRASRNKMAMGKGHTPIKAVLVQEAVPTRAVTNSFVAEPVIYLIGDSVVGSFMRAHEDRGVLDNLNAKGMTFFRYCELHPPQCPEECICSDTHHRVYRLLGRLGALAAAYERADTCHDIAVPPLALNPAITPA
jgi:glutamate--cysteine ligase